MSLPAMVVAALLVVWPARALATAPSVIVLDYTLPDLNAAAVVERLLTHDILVRARAAEARGMCRRETVVRFNCLFVKLNAFAPRLFGVLVGVKLAFQVKLVDFGIDCAVGKTRLLFRR